MHRFFIPPDWIEEGRVSIRGRQVHQLRDVLRLKAGDHIAVLDDTGKEYDVRLDAVDRGRVSGMVIGTRWIPQPRARITLYQALLKAGRFEFVIQKCTELGVAAFVPVICQRCVIKDEVGENRRERWRRIALEAAEQSRRGRVPEIGEMVPFAQACRFAAGLSLLPWEEEKQVGLRAALKPHMPQGNDSLTVNLFIGSEGGFTPYELEVARQCGIVPVTLGARILRAETAGLVAATAILYECGDLDPLAAD